MKKIVHSRSRIEYNIHSNVLTRLKNLGVTHCERCGVQIVPNDRVVTRKEGVKRVVRSIYHKQCAKEAGLI